MRRAVPVIPIEGKKERSRYAKIETYSDEIRLSEGAVYVKLGINFTEDVPKFDDYELIGDVEIVTNVISNGSVPTGRRKVSVELPLYSVATNSTGVVQKITTE